MIRFHVRSAIRSFGRNKGISSVNVIGLSIGLASCFLIVTFLRNELRFDTFHPESDTLYRLISEDSLGTDLFRSANVLGMATLTLDELVAPVVSVSRLHNRQAILSVDDNMFVEPGFTWADPNLFETFGFELAVGDEKTALSAPGTVVISSELATKLFGQSDPMGRTIKADDVRDLTVTGILKSAAGPTHLPTSAFASLLTLNDIQSPWDPKMQGWSFVKTTPGALKKEVEDLINANIAQIIPWLSLDKMYRRYSLQPIQDIRLHSADIVAAGNVSDVRRVVLFAVIVVLVLLLACVNFTNLSTVNSLRRAREVGLRKTIGAGRHQLISQFLIESVGLALVAFLVAIGLIFLSFKWFEQAVNTDLDLSPISQYPLYAWFLGITVLTGLLAGTYPAFYLSRFNPIRVLKGGSPDGRSGRVRGGLVITQFAVSSMLIFGSLVIVAQMRFIQNQNLGFDSEQVVSIESTGLQGDPAVFKQELMELPGIIDVSHASSAPFVGGFISESDWNGEKVTTTRILVDADYVQTMSLKMAEGRFYDPSNPSEMSTSVVVNETWARKKGWDNPLAEQMVVDSDDEGNPIMGPVIGVVKDFKIGSAHEANIPAIFDASGKGARFRRLFLVKIAPGSVESTLAAVGTLWKSHVPNRPLNLTFLDEQIASLHESEVRMSKLLNAFTVLAMFIANLGVLGLASLAIALRKKEVGVRKVLGATRTGLITLLSRDFLMLVLVASFLGLPIAWIATEKWLQDFAFRISIGWEYALLTVLMVAIPAMIMVSSQALRSARAEPTECLRYE
ncbi:MAG: ABC transporter permease [Bacteroidetes bacterium]|nr:ABC transporter permease [Bacteroidota bacterium]